MSIDKCSNTVVTLDILTKEISIFSGVHPYHTCVNLGIHNSEYHFDDDSTVRCGDTGLNDMSGLSGTSGKSTFRLLEIH